jgi:hypothetical protein
MRGPSNANGSPTVQRAACSRRTGGPPTSSWRRPRRCGTRRRGGGGRQRPPTPSTSGCGGRSPNSAMPRRGNWPAAASWMPTALRRRRGQRNWRSASTPTQHEPPASGRRSSACIGKGREANTGRRQSGPPSLRPQVSQWTSPQCYWRRLRSSALQPMRNRRPCGRSYSWQRSPSAEWRRFCARGCSHPRREPPPSGGGGPQVDKSTQQWALAACHQLRGGG